jgi:hypothetical protein
MKKEPTDNPEQLGNLLERYKRTIKPPQQSVLNEVVLVIQDSLGFYVSRNKFDYNVSTRVVYIKTNSLLKTEILRKKSVIKKALSERLGEVNSPLDFV